MDLKTTKQQDFVAHGVEKTKSAKYNRKTNYDVLKFAGVSNYQSEYPNWGHYEFIHIGKFRTPYKTPEVKFNSQTTYGQFFSKDSGSISEVNLMKPKDSNPLTVAGMFFGNTTSRDAFKGYGKNNFPEKAKNVAFGIVSLSSPPQVYNTLYKASYDLKPLSPSYPKKPR